MMLSGGWQQTKVLLKNATAVIQSMADAKAKSQESAIAKDGYLPPICDAIIGTQRHSVLF